MAKGLGGIMKTVVVNLRRAPYDVYIGRAGHGQDGYFGNPFPIETWGRDEALEAFGVHFLTRVVDDPEFRSRVLSLHGKRLGCFCKPKACHGDIMAEWIDRKHGGQG